MGNGCLHDETTIAHRRVVGDWSGRSARGATIRRISSADVPAPVNPSTLAVNAVWQRPLDPPSTAAGMHRFVWDFRPDPPPGGRGRGGGGGGRGGPPLVAPGSYSVKLTVDGKVFRQPLTVKPDPREK